MLKLLEEREDVLVFFDTDSHEARFFPKDDYMSLKYVKFGGGEIFYRFPSTSTSTSTTHTEAYVKEGPPTGLREWGRWTCCLDGESIELNYLKRPISGPESEPGSWEGDLVPDSKLGVGIKTQPGRPDRFVVTEPVFSLISTAFTGRLTIPWGRLAWGHCALCMVARTVLKGDIEAYARVWKLFHAIGRLGLDVVVTQAQNAPVFRQSKLLINESLNVTVDEEMTYADGSHVAKVVFEITDKKNLVLYNVFMHNHYAVALIGRDEIGQQWIHFVPPDYRDKTILDCELWLVGGRKGDEIITP